LKKAKKKALLSAQAFLSMKDFPGMADKLSPGNLLKDIRKVFTIHSDGTI
jgi:hypothetical protein